MDGFLFCLGALIFWSVKGIFLLITWPFRAIWRWHKERQWENRSAVDKAIRQLEKERKDKAAYEKAERVFQSGVKQWFENPNRLPQKVTLHYDRMEFGDFDGPAFVCPYCQKLEWWDDYHTTDGYASDDVNELYLLANKINALTGNRYFIHQELEEKINHPFEGVTSFHYIQHHLLMTLNANG